MAERSKVRKKQRPIKFTDGMKYEATKENKQRRKIIRLDERGSTLMGESRIACVRVMAGVKFRQINKGIIVGRRKYKENYMKIGIGIFLVSVWMSGWFANASSDMRFESLLSVVLGVGVLILIKERKNE